MFPLLFFFFLYLLAVFLVSPSNKHYFFEFKKDLKPISIFSKNIYNCPNSVVRPIITAFRVVDSGSNPGWGTIPFQIGF